MLSYLSLFLLPTAVLSSTQVYFYSNNDRSSLSTSLSQQLALDAFDSPRNYGEEVPLGQPTGFVASGDSEEDLRALVLSIDSEEDILPVDIGGATPTRLADSDEEPTTLLRRYTRAAANVYPKVWQSSTRDGQDDILLATESILRHLKNEPSPQFGGLHITGLKQIAERDGKTSDLYEQVVDNLRNILKTAVLSNYKVAILTPSAPSTAKLSRRQPPQSPFPIPSVPATAPIFSTSTCFTSEEGCQNATSSCSSRGSCVGVTRAGKTCYVCACGKAPLKEGGNNVTWAGGMCEKLDISHEFTLLVGTVLFLIVIVMGSVGLLYSIGDIPLPGTLTVAAGGHAAKRD
ncbi:hypothetical protein M422DRAFT_23471 [Sphaerobolus stellatus SS14]|nr:hypothetical protein M422DRAFT_23471 [Sphaerobolus stellatus SS14]